MASAKLRYRIPRTYLLRELLVVKRKVVVEDGELVVRPSILVEKQLRQEREVLRIPDVHRVARAERDTTGYQQS